MTPSRTRVAVVGAGPAGLVLAALLEREGVDTVVLEARSRAHVETRVRAGVLEQGTVDLLEHLGAGDRLHREAQTHDALEFRRRGRRYRLPVRELTGHPLTFYGQQEVVKDLVRLRTSSGAPLRFEAPVESVEGVASGAPVVRYRDGGRLRELRCEVVAACDGWHGVGGRTVPPSVRRVRERAFPYGWLAVLTEAEPSNDVAVYAAHDDGFALLSMRPPRRSRLYLQCRPDERLADWPDERIWAALRRRLATDDGWTLHDGPVLERSVVPIRAAVSERMQYGDLFLAGDAAHIVPPSGAKGLNLAVRDVLVLAAGLTDLLLHGDRRTADGYTAACAGHVWRAQRFACWMADLLHTPPGEDAFARGLRDAEWERLFASEAAMRQLAEDHVGAWGVRSAPVAGRAPVGAAVGAAP